MQHRSRINIVVQHILPHETSNNNNNNNIKYADSPYASPLPNASLHVIGIDRRKNERPFVLGSDFNSGLPTSYFPLASTVNSNNNNNNNNINLPPKSEIVGVNGHELLTVEIPRSVEEAAAVDHQFRQAEYLHKWWLHVAKHFSHFGNAQLFHYATPNPTKRIVSLIMCIELEDMLRLLKSHPEKIALYERGFLGLGILGQSNVEQWDWQRHHLKPAFSLKALAKLIPIFINGSKSFCDQVGERNGEVFNIHDLLCDTTFKMIGHSALGEEDEFLHVNGKKLRAAFDTIASSPSALLPEVKQANKDMYEFAERVFSRAESKQNSYPPDSLIALITGREAEAPHRPYYPPSVKFDELMTFMFAGHETTANTMAWIFYYLARYPDIQKKVVHDIDSVLAQIKRDKQILSYNNLLKFKYLNRVINETMRLQAVVSGGTFRQCYTDDYIHDWKGERHELKKGAVIFFPTYVVHRNPKYWGADAESFNPDRKWNDRAFMPFTKPNRDCLGRNLANAEIRVLLITVFSRYEVVKGWKDGSPEDNDPGSSLATMRPRYGPNIRFIQRKQ